LEKNASFYYLPHPLVPHKNALFSSRNKILLSENCTLLWGEVITSGRNLNGERFSFTRLHNITEIYIKEQLVIKENVLLCPGTIELNDVGKMEDFTHQASLIYLNEQAQVEVITNELYMQLQSYQGISFGITAAPVNGLIIRILGYKAEQLFHLLNHIADYLNQTAQIHTISSTNLHTYAN
jgi:urease accessory protein